MKRFGKTAARLAVRQTIRISRSAHIAQRPTRIFRLPYFPTQRQPENSPPTFRGWTTAALRSSISSGFAARNSQLETMPRIHDAMAARPSESKPSFQGAIAIIDDEENMCKVLVKILRMENYHVVSYMDPREALDQIRLTHPDVVLTDVRMPGMDGLELLRTIKRDLPNTQVLVMTAYGTIDGVKTALQAGALDYVAKPFRTEELLLSVQKAMEHKRLVEENVSLNEMIRRAAPAATLIGADPQIEEIRQIIRKIAPAQTAVLIRGESGTGKEIVARSIHEQSGRPGRFVPINCASIPDNLLESELFGYEQGAFTCAEQRKLGLIELASNGTLFLDEIGELPPAMQVKLLRVLQEREIQRVGGLRAIQVDIRLLAATNQNLKQLIDDGRFRTDLYYRLNVINIRMPALRERPGDIRILAEFFLKRFAERMARPAIDISEEALDALRRYHWPGNVRELENVIERMTVLWGGGRIELADVPNDILGIPTPAFGFQSVHPMEERADAGRKYQDAKADFEAAYIQQALERAGGNVAEAARMTGISRRNLYEKLEKLGIDPRGYKKP